MFGENELLRGNRMKQTNRFFIGLAVAMLSFFALAKDMPTIDPKAIVAKYGNPDRIQSTEYDKPRPPFVTRMIEYKKENVRFSLLANAPIGSPPPYTSWKLLGFQDPRDNKVISADEVEKRMANRVMK